jgi:histidinol dehydrogenase
MSVIRTVRLSDLSLEDHRVLFERRQSLDDTMPVVQAIMDRVRTDGDAAIRDYTEQFDGPRLDELAVSTREMTRARTALDPRVLRALEAEIEAVRTFHAGHVSTQPPIETAPGVRVWREWRPIDRVGLYVPGGRGPYPSSVVMLGVPASLAGCRHIVLCTPPNRDGAVPAATLVAAELVGIHQVFKIGGAQAIAAMAFGTDSVPRVDKLFGAGNAYVTAAKLLAFPRCDLDAPAGPSELLIIADAAAHAACIAADLLSDAEHGPDSPAVLVTTSGEVAEAVARALEEQLASLPRAGIARAALNGWGRIVVADTLEDAAAFADEYAPEHLEIMTGSPGDLLGNIRNAGSVFLGPYAPNAAGDYATGTNHVLPTSRYARTFSPVSVESFGRKVQCQEVSRDGLLALCSTVQSLARAEGLEGHARAVEIRFAEREA